MVRMNTKSLLDGLHSIFEALLRSSAENRALCLNWLWGCVEANNARSKIMSAYASLAENELELLNTISDGFALNLELLVLRLCEPFCNPPPKGDESAMNPKILTIDPTYTAVESGPFCRAKWHEETCLMPLDENPDGSKVSFCEILVLAYRFCCRLKGYIPRVLPLSLSAFSWPKRQQTLVLSLVEIVWGD